MAQSGGGSIAERVRDATHAGKRKLSYMLGKGAVEAGAAEAVGGGQALASALSGTLTGAGTSLVAIAALGGVAAVSASLAQMDYRHENEKIKEFSDKLKEHAAPQDAAQPNRTINEAFEKNKKERNFGIVLSVISSLTAFTLVTLAFAAAPESLVMMAAKGLTGLMVYTAVKTPLKWMGHKAFGLEKPTTYDHILALKHELEEGKHIKREQVFSVALEANPEINAYIAKNYGAEFNKLADEDHKKEVMEHIGQLINLNQLTYDINHKKADISVLALVMDGKGYTAKPEGLVEKPESSLLTRAVEKCIDLAKNLSGKPELAPASPAPANPPLKPAPATFTYHPADSSPPGAHLARLGREPADVNLTALERLAKKESSLVAAGGRGNP